MQIEDLAPGMIVTTIEGGTRAQHFTVTKVEGDRVWTSEEDQQGVWVAWDAVITYAPGVEFFEWSDPKPQPK